MRPRKRLVVFIGGSMHGKYRRVYIEEFFRNFYAPVLPEKDTIALQGLPALEEQFIETEIYNLVEMRFPKLKFSIYRYVFEGKG